MALLVARLTPLQFFNQTPHVLGRLGHLIVVAALLAAIGGHWAILQSVAWATMLADNLQTASVSEAVSKTFDGEHPCALCKRIAEGKKSEKKSDAPDLKVKKLEFATERVTFLFVAPAEFRLLPELIASSNSFSLVPPVPPPRCAAV